MKRLFLLVTVFFYLIIFRNWFFPGLIQGGDFWPYSKSMYSIYSIFPYAWDSIANYGMGSSSVSTLWIQQNFGIGVWFYGKFLNLDWQIIERLYYLYPLILLLFFGPFLLFRFLFPKSNLSFLSSIIYGLNTYILMIIGGGQLQGVGMAYSLVPFIFYFILRFNAGMKSVGVISLTLACLMLFDIRISLITIFIIPIFLLIFKNNNFLRVLSFKFLMPLFLATLIHSFWILPLILYPLNPFKAMGEQYNSIESLKFLSFARLENTLSLLHPNWYENIFGKTQFMKYEFLLLPLLAFLSLIFIKKDIFKRRIIIFFALISLIGAFLAKGINEPFGDIYYYLFNVVPGFKMFRDPTKFYFLVALGFSILVPYSLEKIIELFSRYKYSKVLRSSIVVLAFIVIAYQLLPAIDGKLTGTFRDTSIPDEYNKLSKLISKDNGFYRTLWVPGVQRFAYFSDKHPAVFDNNRHIYLNSELLNNSSIRYVIVPFDTENEFFSTDGIFDIKKFSKTLFSVRTNNSLNEIGGFDKIKVFENQSFKPHFYSMYGTTIDNVTFNNPSSYNLSLKNAKIGDKIIFSESFDKFWFAKSLDSNSLSLQSKRISRSSEGFNEFTLSKTGNYNVEVYYAPQIAVNFGAILSLVAILVAIILVLVGVKNKKNKKNFKYGNLLNESTQLFRFDLYNKIGLQKLFKRKKLLDLGCGYGIDSKNFLKYARTVVGTDIDKHVNWQTYANKNLKFVQSNSEKLPFRSNTFDAIFLKDLLHHVEFPDLVLKEIKRVCREKGVIVIVEGNRYNPIFYVWATLLNGHNHFSQTKFKNIINKHFSDVEFIYLECYPPFFLNSFFFKKILTIESYAQKIKFLQIFFSYNVAIIKL